MTLAEIARLAGVGRAAVSNWRRRHATFPGRIGGTDVSPQFSMAEIEAWLRENGKIQKSAEREWLWPRFEALAGRDETGLAIAEVGRRLAGRGAGGSGLLDEVRPLVERAVEIGRSEGGAETFEFLLHRWLDVHVRQIATTPEPLAALMAELAFRTVVDAKGSRHRTTVMDPACGTGHLLAAAAGSAGAGAVTLIGGDRDPVLAALACVRLELAAHDGSRPRIDVRPGDSLRADPFADTPADIALCNPPFNERDWGYEELATDARWSHGLPPRTEPELAWVQHCLARLRPGGAAVLLLPPAVAARRAGRRIRGSLLRTGHLQAVVALPPGCAAPHSVSLHLWVLRVPDPKEEAQVGGRLLLADAASRFPRASARDSVPDWAAIGAFVRDAFDAADGTEPWSSHYVRTVPVIDLLGDEVDLTPGRHIAPSPADTGRQLAVSWKEFSELVTGMGKSARLLAGLGLTSDAADTPTATTVAELARAGALTLRGGQQPPEGTVGEGQPVGEGFPLLTVPDLLVDGQPHGWLAPDVVSASGAVVAEAGDVVVVGVARAFSAWVHDGPPTVLGPQLHAVRVQPEQLDAWFLAGSLRAPANARQAGTHTSSSSRIDVRRLQVRQVPLNEQRRYGAAFRELAEFEGMVRRADTLGHGLVRDLGDELAAGRLSGAV
ncbi:N-6 DNA methylase [Streptomyces antimycoticus]|uniref:Type II restriction endonuclease subunit M n=1 Tax=Streptomyces antimycoticus TaxID=68175 RepID=A0A4D4KL24_9ACTN|nr:type II restriction endonuclease subunit M [Streptomyces antimycoticus]